MNSQLFDNLLKVHLMMLVEDVWLADYQIKAMSPFDGWVYLDNNWNLANGEVPADLGMNLEQYNLPYIEQTAVITVDHPTNPLRIHLDWSWHQAAVVKDLVPTGASFPISALNRAFYITNLPPGEVRKKGLYCYPLDRPSGRVLATLFQELPSKIEKYYAP